ncbi:hypothetical protein AGMMS50256_29470 [Betaproteobacteria bacterium]|nr:hypothetical protein AGMMS50256_29470 [Betaproteobacteria bacterium]
MIINRSIALLPLHFRQMGCMCWQACDISQKDGGLSTMTTMIVAFLEIQNILHTYGIAQQEKKSNV